MMQVAIIVVFRQLLQLVVLFATIRADSNRLNVLFIIADDLRPTLGCYQQLSNHRQTVQFHTPNINRLAAEGTLFSNAHAQLALCGPSRTSLLTARRPDTLQIFDNSHSYWRTNVANFSTLPQYFREHGYVTISAGKVFHPGKLSNKTDDYPYSWSLPPYHPSTLKYEQSKLCRDANGTIYDKRNVICPIKIDRQPQQTLPDLQTADYVVRLLHNDSITGRPFFIAVGFHKPHIPLRYPEQFQEFYDLAKISIANNSAIPARLPTVAWNPWMSIRERDDVAALNVSFPYGPLPVDFQKQLRQSYYASVSYMDEQVGKLIDTLRQRQLIDKTIIVFTSDHGWSLGEHGEWEKYSNFGVATRVPFIVRLPKTLRRRSIITNLIELVDIYPTLAELAQLPVPATCNNTSSSSTSIDCVESNSFASLITKNKYENKHWKSSIFGQYPRPSLLPQLNSDQPRYADIDLMGYSIRTRRYRYTEWIDFGWEQLKNTKSKRRKVPNWNRTHARELYSIVDDGDENENIVDDRRYASIVNRLAKRLRLGWQAAAQQP